MVLIGIKIWTNRSLSLDPPGFEHYDVVFSNFTAWNLDSNSLSLVWGAITFKNGSFHLIRAAVE